MSNKKLLITSFLSGLLLSLAAGGIEVQQALAIIGNDLELTS